MGHLSWRSLRRSQKLSVVRKVIGGGSLLVVLGCQETPIDFCCFVNIHSQVIVQGITTEADGNPVSGTAVAPLGQLMHQCTNEIRGWSADPAVALSDTDGFFRLRLETHFGGGPYCLDFTATHPDGVRIDTLRNIELLFKPFVEPNALTPDTVFLQIVFAG